MPGITAIREADYDFAASYGHDEWVTLEFRTHDEAARSQFADVWLKLYTAIRNQYKLANSGPPPDWSKWSPHDWCQQKTGYENRQKYAAWAGNRLAGFLNLWAGFPSQFDAGAQVLYVEHMAAAPGNLDSHIWARRLGHVGKALMAFVAFQSIAQGFDGRFGLHVDGGGALDWYRKVDSEMNGTLFHPDGNEVLGPTPHGAADKNRVYLEATAVGAREWLEAYRRE